MFQVSVLLTKKVAFSSLCIVKDAGINQGMLRLACIKKKKQYKQSIYLSKKAKTLTNTSQCTYF